MAASNDALLRSDHRLLYIALLHPRSEDNRCIGFTAEIQDEVKSEYLKRKANQWTKPSLIITTLQTQKISSSRAGVWREAPSDVQREVQRKGRSEAEREAPMITTSWVLSPTRSTVALYGFFTSSSTALSDGASDKIPSGDVLGEVTTGGAYKLHAV